ncbi:MAG: sulfatase-like hydrolase/transferase [Planctomycetia bacterium]|nr:sulfatase-like hydrolase/transferase [Planctomycetia bacterium]
MNNIICFFIDGFHSGFPGAYGNSEGLTPALDSLASESVLFDQYFTNTMDLSRLYAAYWQGMDPAKKDPISSPSLFEILRDQNYRTVLLSNDRKITELPISSEFEEIALFEDQSEGKADPPESLEESPLFTLFSEWASKILRTFRSGNERPFFIWCHLKDFYAPQNIPSDPEEESADDPIDLNREKYKSAIRILDDLLAGMLDVFDEYDLWNNTIFLLGGARGCNFEKQDLAQAIFRKEESIDLVPDEIHLPLLIRFPAEEFASVRVGGLCQPDDLYRTLRFILSGRAEEPSGLFPLMEETRDQIRPSVRVVENGSGSNNRVLITDKWYLKIRKDPLENSDPKYELYVRPDDRWCVNEVADRCEEIVEELSRQWDSN